MRAMRRTRKGLEGNGTWYFTVFDTVYVCVHVMINKIKKVKYTKIQINNYIYIIKLVIIG